MAVELNIDLGEGAGGAALAADLELLASADRVNVACGFHAGDTLMMAALCRAAGESGRALGAHVSYRDRASFGRRETGAAPATIAAETLEQLELLAEIAATEGAAVTHVKPHGALYHRLCSDEEAAAAFSETVAGFAAGLELLTLPGSALIAAGGNAGLPVLLEGFADRAYLSGGGLLARDHPDALLGPEAAAEQARAIAQARPLATSDGSSITLDVATVCVHGDGPDAISTARAVRRALDEAHR